MLPTIQFGDYAVSRLIIGGNPFSGNSHVSGTLDQEMTDYYTVDQIKKTLSDCEKHGINTMQLRGDRHIGRMIHEYQQDGGTLHWIAQHAPEMGNFQGNLDYMMRYKPIGIYHQGTTTDRLFLEGNTEEIAERLRQIRATGVLVGLGTHRPDVIEYAEEQGWDLDFYMACVYNLSKSPKESSAITGKPNAGEDFNDEDCPVMYRTIRATEKPCLAFKILAASRRCKTAEMIRDAYREAFANIKETDAVVVGMYPSEQVAENAAIVREILRG